MILFLNTDKNLEDEICNITKNNTKDVTSIFINWIPTKKDANLQKASILLSQTETIEKHIGKVPIVIFDKYSSISTNEYNWLKKNNVTFFEPVLCCRNGFKYLPHSTKIKTVDDISINSEKRHINIGYVGSINDRIKLFEKFVLSIKESFPELHISYETKSISQEAEDRYDRIGVKNKKIDLSDTEFLVIIGNKNDFNLGRLDNYFFKALENNCVPLIPKDNRYYQAFTYILKDSNWYNWFQSLYDKIYIGMLADLYKDIKKYYPEMDISYTAETIKHYLQEK
jgi:hypothetical protein